MKIFKCNHCGNVITKLSDKGIPVVCCGEKMNELIPNEVDASIEKHVPVIEDNRIIVGDIKHPMEETHYIEWIIVNTENETLIKYLKPNDLPVFELNCTSPIRSVYAYCNLHGLWKR